MSNQWFLGLKAKLVVSFSIIIIFLAGSIFEGFKSLDSMKGLLEEMYDEHYTASVGITTIYGKLNGVRAALVTMMGETDKTKQEAQHKVINELTEEIDSLFDTLLKNPAFPPDMIQPLKEIQSIWAAFKDTRDNQIIPALYDGRLEEAKGFVLGIQKERYNKFVSMTDKLLDQKTKESQEAIRASRKEYKTLIITLLVIGLLAVSVSVLMAIFLARGIATPVKAMAETAQRIASGDLNVNIEVKSKDEIGVLGNAFMTMVMGLRDVVGQIRGALSR